MQWKLQWVMLTLGGFYPALFYPSRCHIEEIIGEGDEGMCGSGSHDAWLNFVDAWQSQKCRGLSFVLVWQRWRLANSVAYMPLALSLHLSIAVSALLSTMKFGSWLSMVLSSLSEHAEKSHGWSS